MLGVIIQTHALYSLIPGMLGCDNPKQPCYFRADSTPFPVCLHMYKRTTLWTEIIVLGCCREWLDDKQYQRRASGYIIMEPWVFRSDAREIWNARGTPYTFLLGCVDSLLVLWCLGYHQFQCLLSVVCKGADSAWLAFFCHLCHH